MEPEQKHPPNPPEQSAPPQPPASAALDAQLQQAMAHHRAGQLPQAEALYRQILQLAPNHVDALYLLSVIACQCGQYAAAVELTGQALLLRPAFPEALHHRGIALYSLGQYSAALDSLDQAILHRPEYAEAYSVRGSALNELHQDEAAVESFDRAIQLNPNDAAAHGNRANALNTLRRYPEAIESCNRAIQLNPGFVEVWNNRGNAFYKLQHYQQAQHDFNECIRLKPDYAKAWNHLGAVLDGMRQYQEAHDAVDRAILLNPDVAGAHLNRGIILQHLEQYPLALESFTQALRLEPDCDYVAGIRLHMRRFLCDWEHLDAECGEVEARIDRNRRAAAPFVTLSLTGSPALQKKAAEIFVLDHYPAPADATPIPRRAQRDKIRIGYFSADFHQHAVCMQMIDVFELHDRSKFEILGFSFGAEIKDEMNRRVSAAMDQFLDVSSLSDREVAELSRNREVDIAVDLMGFTDGFRLGIFAQRAAPIQVNYLGHPGTAGADYIDYLIADNTLVPEASRPHYSEKIVSMPDSFQANSRHPISRKQYTRREEGLPEEGFIFCCFNNRYKIGPATFAAWMRILRQVEGSVLWLLAGHPLADANLRQQAAQHGIAPERLFFAQRLPLAEHLSRQRVADLFLDTLPFNAGATASPALWAGLPVLTCVGETFAGRMGASLLRAMSLPESDLSELITTSEPAYEALAIELARNPERLRGIRERLDRNRLTTPLFDTVRFTRNLEAAYSAMLQRYHAGLPPDHIHVAGSSASPQPGFAAVDPDRELIDRQLKQAMTHLRAAELPQAETLCRRVLQDDPGHVDALYLLSVIACQSGQYATAVDLTAQALLHHPDVVELHATRANALAALRQYQAALESFDRTVHLKPEFVEAHCDRGSVLSALKRYPEAIESYDRAIHLRPSFATAHCNRGLTLYELHQYQAALDSLDQAILHRANYAAAYSTRGLVFYSLGQYQAAFESFDRALQINPNHAATHGNRANALLALHRYREAIESCDRALQINPGFVEVWGRRGNSFYALQQYQQAEHDFNECIRLQPDCAKAWNNLGTLFFQLLQSQAALDAIDRAILINPDVAEPYANRGNVLQSLEQYPLALESFTQALRLDPDSDYVAGMRLHMKRFLCDWENLEVECRQVEAAVDRNQKVAAPSLTLNLIDSPARQKQAAEIFVRDRYPVPADATPIPRRPQRDKIRIGYFSADFHQHAVCLQMIDLFERHDHSKFEILGFSFGPDVTDEMTHRVSAAMDQFLDVRSLSDREVVELSRKLEVDIAVDLMVFTEYFRLGIFAQRAAPIQVNYLGYPGTVGADYIDYLIADSTLVPEASQPHYSEKIITMPDSFQVNSRHPISDKLYTRSEEGLPEQGFIFCCFNNSCKIGPATFAVWMRILKQVEGSVLWLLAGHPLADANLRQQAAQHGIAPERLFFAQRLPLAEHLSRQRVADLFLDTLPFNAGATASPALWAGLPVLTCVGETFAGRMGASLLRALDLPELIATSEPAYEALAIELARNPERLRGIRERLDRNRLTTPLFDTVRFTRNLEAAYSAMLQRYHAGLPPDHIHV